MEFALEAIESPKGRHASAMENAEHALEHLCSVERRLDLSNEKCSSKAGSSNSAVLFFAPRVVVGQPTPRTAASLAPHKGNLQHEGNLQHAGAPDIKSAS